MTIGDRFKEIRQLLNLNQSELARELSINPSLISDIERGDKEPSKKVITSLIFRYNINANWLLTEQGDIYQKQDSGENTPLEKELHQIIQKQTDDRFVKVEDRLAALETLLKKAKNNSEVSSVNKEPFYTSESEPAYGEYELEEDCEEIPYVHDIAAGPPIAQSEDMGDTVLVPCHLMKKGRRYYAASIRGTSMTEAGIHDGDIILIRCENVPRDNAIQVVQYDGKSTLKLLKQNEGNGWELHYRDGTGQIINCQSNDYKTQGEFEAVLPKIIVLKK